MKKHLSLPIILIILLLNKMPLAAMQEQTTYPWYQSYRNPAVQERWQRTKERTSRGWQKAKELVQRNKRAIALAAVLIGATYIGNREYNKIAREYSAEGLTLHDVSSFF